MKRCELGRAFILSVFERVVRFCAEDQPGNDCTKCRTGEKYENGDYIGHGRSVYQKCCKGETTSRPRATKKVLSTDYADYTDRTKTNFWRIFSMPNLCDLCNLWIVHPPKHATMR